MIPASDKDKQQKILAVVLLVFLGLLILWNVKRQMGRRLPRPQAPPPSVTRVEPSPPPLVVSPAPESSEIPSDELSKKSALTWKRDPFLLGLGEEGSVPTLQLKVSGIIYDEERPEATYAIINGEVFRIGDTIQGIKVIDIQPDFVRLLKFNQDVFLYLYEKEGKK